jgi:hypothetical protein
MTSVHVNVYNPFDTPLFIKSMRSDNYWQGKYFGELKGEVNMVVPPKSSVLSPVVPMASPAGFGFMGTLLHFMLANPQLLLGISADVVFDTRSEIVAYVGGPDGYMGNVSYNQTETIIKVQVGGKAPAGALPASLADLVPHENNSTTTPLPSPAAPTNGAPTSTVVVSPTAASSLPPPATASPTGAATVPVVAPIAKRQVQTLENGPGSEDPAVVEAWIKAMVNKLANDKGLPNYY